MRPTSVSRIAAGCSSISLRMNVSYPPFWARATSQSTVIGCGWRGAPSRSVNDAPSRRTSTTMPSSSGITVVVRSSTAGMSEASIVSPSPTPTISGDDTFTPTSTSGSSREQTTSEYAPSSSRTAPRTASGSDRPSRSISSMRWATHSVSVSETRVWPSFSRRARSAWKFSMMPLWITATRPAQSRCGWALRSVGAPWVAQRVWPMPTAPPGMPSASSAASSSASLPARFTTPSPPSITATPAESYPRYSSRRRPSRTIGSASSGPT